VLDILVQDRRDQQAAERFLRQVLEGEDGRDPRVVITDKLASYPPAIRKVLPHTEHRGHKRLNNRAENSHVPTGKRERVLQRFKSAEHAQQFLGPFSAVCNRFRPRTGLSAARAYGWTWRLDACGPLEAFSELQQHADRSAVDTDSGSDEDVVAVLLRVVDAPWPFPPNAPDRVGT
jgi:putative transposase